MRKLLVLSLFAAAVQMLSSQVLVVRGIERVGVPQSEAMQQVVGISPQGDYLLLSSQSHEGLVRYDLSSHQATTLSTSGAAGFNARVSADGKRVVYQEMSVRDGVELLHGVKSVDVTTMERTVLAEPQPNFSSLAVAGDIAVAMIGGKVNAKSVRGASGVKPSKPVVTSENLKLYLTIDGTTRQFTPQGDELSYIWASVSPDGSKVLYFCSDAGQCIVANLDGSEVGRYGYLMAPQWLDDNTIVGFDADDDGKVYTRSKLVAFTLDGTRQDLTDDRYMAMWPQVAQGKIAFCNPTGEIYIINYTKQ